MIAVLTDIIQSMTILCWAVIMFFLIRRINKLDKSAAQNAVAIAQIRGNWQLEEQPFCGCGHHQCFHDENSCGKSEQLYDQGQYKVVSCGCKRYTGPEPLPTVIP